MPINLSSLVAALFDANAENRAQAAEQLAVLGADAQPAAVALVLACGDEAEEVREWTTSALENLGPPEATDVGPLMSLIEAKTPDVGYWAATLLGRLKAQAAPAVETLARAVAVSPHLPVRQRAAWAVGEIAPVAADALPNLCKAPSDPESRLARLAQEAINPIAE
jgi:HEAT repeat protein